MACFRTESEAIILTVRLTPRADRDAVEGTSVLADGREVARVRVRAVPEDGAANTALARLIAKILRQPKSTVAVVAGATQRVKQVRIAGDAGKLVPLVAAMVAR